MNNIYIQNILRELTEGTEVKWRCSGGEVGGEAGSRLNIQKQKKVFRSMQVGAYHLALPHEILLFLLW